MREDSQALVFATKIFLVLQPAVLPRTQLRFHSSPFQQGAEDDGRRFPRRLASPFKGTLTPESASRKIATGTWTGQTGRKGGKRRQERLQGGAAQIPRQGEDGQLARISNVKLWFQTPTVPLPTHVPPPPPIASWKCADERSRQRMLHRASIVGAPRCRSASSPLWDQPLLLFFLVAAGLKQATGRCKTLHITHKHKWNKRETSLVPELAAEVKQRGLRWSTHPESPHTHVHTPALPTNLLLHPFPRAKVFSLCVEYVLEHADHWLTQAQGLVKHYCGAEQTTACLSLCLRCLAPGPKLI